MKLKLLSSVKWGEFLPSGEDSINKETKGSLRFLSLGRHYINA